jgi:arginine decarboxylase
MSDEPARTGTFRAHYDASQFRTDKWNELKHLTARWDRATRETDKESLKTAVRATLDAVEALENYWVFPGKRTCRQLRQLVDKGWHRILAQQTARIVRLLVDDAYRRRHIKDIIREDFSEGADGHTKPTESPDRPHNVETRPYFEVLLVDDLTPEEEADVRHGLLAMRQENDEFIYDVVVVPTFEDAVISVLFNHNIQSCVLRYEFAFETANPIPELLHYTTMFDRESVKQRALSEPAAQLGRTLKHLRPELDLFLVTDEPVEDIAGRKSRHFSRVFYHQEDYMELHLSILKGIHDRFDTPFFTALKHYSQKPTGVFHAMPISRGKSITKSHWIKDMGQFYGSNIFLAETSATSGGLDSLLQPHGPLKVAQEKVARAFGARKSFFVTNGTSTANKIVMQALVRPGDLVLVSRDCHKSHHYSLVLSGAYPVYLDPYPLTEFSMYGAVPLVEIKKQLLRLKKEGLLDRVRMLLLTSCTFDGVVYNPERVMQEVLAIKPDMIFVWDEAWFGFARFTPTYRQRTAMAAAQTLSSRFKSLAYQAQYIAWRQSQESKGVEDEAAWLENKHLPDPDRVRVRVYATQSTHKTLTALRQGSMIHVHDQDFDRLAHDAFHEAYMTHTSTSPNYQILASLDVGRRQVELEGYELVKKSVELAMMLRARIKEHPLLNKYFRVLDAHELIPGDYRPSGYAEICKNEGGFTLMDDAWAKDEFSLDPTRLTVHVGMTGSDGDTFRHLLMDQYDIQINKTSRNTVLFMLNIGTTRGNVAYLLDVLTKIAQEIEERVEQQSSMERRIAQNRISSLTEKLPPLPNFSSFHSAFAPFAKNNIVGDLRKAFFLAYDQATYEYLKLENEVAEAMKAGREVVSATFVTPYPPGFPVLVPGQIVSPEILAYLQALDVKEIHGYEPQYGLRVFTRAALEAMQTQRPTEEVRVGASAE